MANLEKPVPRNFAPAGVLPEAAVLSIGGVVGFLVGRLLSPSVLVATMTGLAGAAAGALAAKARRIAVVPPRPDPVVSYLSEHLGPEMTAFLSGAESPAVVSGWISGETLPDPLEKERLIAARKAVEELAGAYSDDMIKTWFFGKNEWLGDRAPALILREGRQPDDWRAVQPAAEEFAESAY